MKSSSFVQMGIHGSCASIRPSFLQLLESCVAERNLSLGRQIHSRIIVAGQTSDSFLTTKLITLYSSCEDIHSAHIIFRRIPTCNVFQLNAMIKGYSSNGFYRDAINLLHEKRSGDGVPLDSYTFSSVLKACASLSDIYTGKIVHELASDRGLGSDVFVCNSLICMYAKCGCLEDVDRVFEEMHQRDIVSWNSIIKAYLQHGLDLQALQKVTEMVEIGLRLDQVTLVSILTMSTIWEAAVRKIHGFVFRNGYQCISIIQNALISAYGKCGAMRTAQNVFDSLVQKDRVTWNALIAGYSQNLLFEDSMRVLRDMKLSKVGVDVVTYSGIISSFSQNDKFYESIKVFQKLLAMGLKPDAVAIASVLPAISGLKYLKYCEQIHVYCYRHTIEQDRRVRNSLISVYSQCGVIQKAKQIFNMVEKRDVISWSSMVSGYAQNDFFIQALDTFGEMVGDGIVPNPIALTSVLSACAGISGLKEGKELHAWVIKNSYAGHSFVGSALIDMYAKCGEISNSRKVFNLMEDRNVVTWNSMIGGYAIHGLYKDALEIFRMLKEPDEVSFMTVLSACRHGGLVKEGVEIFDSMKNLNVSSKEAHYACIVDLLGRSGKLEQALQLIRTMPMKPSAEIWGALLGACKIHSNLGIGVVTGEQIVQSENKNSGYYVLLSNVLADSDRWEEVQVVRELMKAKGVKKGAACSWR